MSADRLAERFRSDRAEPDRPEEHPSWRRFGVAMLVWVVVMGVGLAIAGTLDVERFVVASVLGVLVLTELLAPPPGADRRPRWLTAAVVVGLLVVAALALGRILAYP